MAQISNGESGLSARNKLNEVIDKIEGNSAIGNNIDVTGTVTMDGGSTSADFTFGDNDKAIFGAGSDLQIYHDGSQSYIKDAGTGNLLIQGANIRLESDTGENFLAAFPNAEVRLYYDSVEKLATTATGIDVTGTITADGLTVDGDNDVNFRGNNNDIVWGSPSSDYAAIRRYNGAAQDVGLTFHSTTNAGVDGAPTRMKIDHNGDISFYEDTGTTPKFFWDASAESLGIGTTSLSTNSIIKELHIDSPYTNGLSRLRLSSSVENMEAIVGLTGYLNEDALYFAIGSSGDGSATERMRIDSSGNVGIGVAPYSWSNLTALQLERASVSGGDPDTYFTSNGYYSTTAPSGWKYGSATTATQMYMNASGGEFVFRNAASGTAGAALTWSEAMRIDSSGNLLVGKTAATISTEGAELRPTGEVVATADGLNVAYFNRLTSDGSIAEFRKDGTTVGSIGTTSGDLTISSSASSHAGLRFSNSNILPLKDGALSAGGIDLGQSSGNYGFKDLYLSGGVYLGGTGAANKLDDYEEGSWTPGTSSGTISAINAKYTKIGRSVTVSALIYNISDQSSSNVFTITNLPFASCASCRQVGAIMMRYQNNTSLTASYITQSTTNVEFYGVHAGGWDVAVHSDWNNINSEVYFTVTYNAA